MTPAAPPKLHLQQITKILLKLFTGAHGIYLSYGNEMENMYIFHSIFPNVLHFQCLIR